MKKPCRLSDFAHLLELSVSHDVDISGVAVDSRLLKPQELFIALRGAQVDGHDFLEVAASKGAAAAIVNQSYAGSDFGLPLIRVEDSSRALQAMAKALIERRAPKVVGVTGSVGKTTTKDFITTLLKQKFRVASTPGNSNSQIGMPLAVLNHTQGDEEILVLEMGMTEKGQIANLVQLAPPDVAVITTVGLVHACYFDSLKEIAQAKAEIFSHSKTKLGILPLELENFKEVLQVGTCRKLSFSVVSSVADFNLSAISEVLSLESFKIPGKHNTHNLLAAIACARCLEVDWELIQKGIEELVLPEKRLQIVLKDGITFVNDSYNASQLSVQAALEILPEPQKNGKKIVALGEMLELGKYSRQCHLEIAESALKFADEIFCLGQECKVVKEHWDRNNRPAHWFFDRSDLVKALREKVKSGDVVLLKGSRAKQMWKVLEEL
jgi:UDP-N-acetylmuramoyl-tripeptide--D-alanyl-D-alanine ligase